MDAPFFIFQSIDAGSDTFQFHVGETMVVTPLLLFLLGSDFSVGFRDGCKMVMFFMLHMDVGWHGRIEVLTVSSCISLSLGQVDFSLYHMEGFSIL